MMVRGIKVQGRVPISVRMSMGRVLIRTLVKQSAPTTNQIKRTAISTTQYVPQNISQNVS